jgi:hypothetical protein
MNYFYQRVEEAAYDLSRSDDVLRAAFGELLSRCALALHDIEWVDSCDYGPGDEHAAIQAVLGVQGDDLVATYVKNRVASLGEQLGRLFPDAGTEET